VVQARQRIGEIKCLGAVVETERFQLVRMQHAPQAVLQLQADQHAVLSP